jgi:hypothetical protein
MRLRHLPPRHGQIIDLMQALKQSIEEARPKAKAIPAKGSEKRLPRSQRPLFHLLGLRCGLVKPRLEVRPSMLPGLSDSGPPPPASSRRLSLATTRLSPRDNEDVTLESVLQAVKLLV